MTRRSLFQIIPFLAAAPVVAKPEPVAVTPWQHAALTCPRKNGKSMMTARLIAGHYGFDLQDIERVEFDIDWDGHRPIRQGRDFAT